MARKYVRDKKGRFASTGGGGKSSSKGGRWQNVTNEKGQVVGVRDATKGPRWRNVTNAKGQVVGVRDANKAKPSGATVQRVMRQRRAVANSKQAHEKLVNTNDIKAARKRVVAKRALDIYSGKVDPKAKTKARLSRKR